MGEETPAILAGFVEKDESKAQHSVSEPMTVTVKCARTHESKVFALLIPLVPLPHELSCR